MDKTVGIHKSPWGPLRVGKKGGGGGVPGGTLGAIPGVYPPGVPPWCLSRVPSRVPEGADGAQSEAYTEEARFTLSGKTRILE